jgi:hypothetical protein
MPSSAVAQDEKPLDLHLASETNAGIPESVVARNMRPCWGMASSELALPIHQHPPPGRPIHHEHRLPWDPQPRAFTGDGLHGDMDVAACDIANSRMPLDPVDGSEFGSCKSFDFHTLLVSVLFDLCSARPPRLGGVVGGDAG